MTAKYEAMMIFSVANGEEQVNSMVEKFKALIEKNGTFKIVKSVITFCFVFD